MGDVEIQTLLHKLSISSPVDGLLGDCGSFGGLATRSSSLGVGPRRFSLATSCCSTLLSASCLLPREQPPGTRPLPCLSCHSKLKSPKTMSQSKSFLPQVVSIKYLVPSDPHKGNQYRGDWTYMTWSHIFVL